MIAAETAYFLGLVDQLVAPYFLGPAIKGAGALTGLIGVTIPPGLITWVLKQETLTGSLSSFLNGRTILNEMGTVISQITQLNQQLQQISQRLKDLDNQTANAAKSYLACLQQSANQQSQNCPCMSGASAGNVSSLGEGGPSCTAPPPRPPGYKGGGGGGTGGSPRS